LSSTAKERSAQGSRRCRMRMNKISSFLLFLFYNLVLGIQLATIDEIGVLLKNIAVERVYYSIVIIKNQKVYI
jgi:hypothetical protein